jgi:Reverse transcriptase (RNA-dependent DNA polymerase)
VISIIEDAYEDRDVGIGDIAGAYLKADMDDFVVMKFTGEAVRILCEMNPAHKENVVIENGIETLYVVLDKALYGCVKSALLWYNLLTDTIKGLGFKLNPYDQCVANCTIDGSTCTIAWYVDDLKISHRDPTVVTAIIEKLEAKFGKMSVSRGREHNFLGMKVRYNGDRTATITMKDYLQEAIDESGLDIKKEVSTPAMRTLFDINDSALALNTQQSERFHSVVAKLLYVSLRARMDLLLAVAFLCTRVSRATVQDLSKLKRVLEYVKGTLDLEYTVGADNLGKLRYWVDASYAVHPDMRSHTGGIMSFGTGGIMCKSSKQKLNTKSSTEAELVGVSDYLPNAIWAKMFLEGQGHRVTETWLEQDNESAIRLEKNGRASAGPKSRHIDIRFFWVKDRISSGDISVRHCPTLQMLADFFTKPLQGNLFRKFRDVILGINHIDTLSSTPRSQPEERVEIRPGKRDADSASNATDSMKRSDSGMKKVDTSTTVSWVDIVKRTPATERSNVVAREKNRRVNELVAIGHSIATIPN